MTATLTLQSNAAMHHNWRIGFRQTAAMSKRSVLALWRQPALVVPSMIFPLFFAALGTSSFGRAINLPGFPKVDSFLDFSLAGTIVQGVLFGSVQSGSALATDIENGFFYRLMAAPSSRLGILVGRLAGAAAYGAFQTLFFSLLLLPFGMSIKGGPLGVLVMVLSGGLIAIAISGFMAAAALKTGSSEAVQGIFPLVFIMLFFSSAFFPRQTMSGAYKHIADFNPISHLIEGLRDICIDGLSSGAIARAILVPVAIMIVSFTLALRALAQRTAAQ
ncbi:MAG: hypothetical protein EBY23_01480 [Actinobacteria bacterium]|jgi:ABC-2 type transport system permease protein|uniref:Unannotated protein n=1 Tax=freshwater metagenome TaxID=449393 RepID=A0A6J7UDB2_9ZZZZ|nr:hypothetical protein [Actinomycetota bacterium]NDG65591.1 hypothetical protein [Actinomycetota bacterium]